MTHAEYVHRVVNLLAPDGDTLLNMDHAEAVRRVAAGDPALIDQNDGHFAILAQSGRMVHMARSIGRPMRYFLAKRLKVPAWSSPNGSTNSATGYPPRGWATSSIPPTPAWFRPITWYNSN